FVNCSLDKGLTIPDNQLRQGKVLAPRLRLRGVRFLSGEDVMTRQRGTVGAGMLLGLLVLGAAGRADEAAAVKMVEKLGGNVVRDQRVAGEPVVAVDLYDTQITDAGLRELKELNSLQELDLGRTAVTDIGLKELKGLKSLQRLSLFNTKVTDAGLKELKELKGLQRLGLYNTKVTDMGVKELKAALPGLKIIR